MGYLSLFASGSFIIPYPSFVSLFCVIASIPILGVLLTLYKGNACFNGQIIGMSDANESEQTISLHIKLTCIVLAISVYRNFNCGNYYNLFIHGGIVFIFFYILFFLAHRKTKGELKERLFIYAELTLYVILYSYAVTFGVNCLFDSSPPERFETRVVSKSSKGGGDCPPRRYYVTVAAWENHPSKEDLPMSEKEYELADTGDYIYINVQKGLLSIPWFYKAPRK